MKTYQFPTYRDYTSEYDVDAKVPEGATADQVKLMLRNLAEKGFASIRAAHRGTFSLTAPRPESFEIWK